MSPDSLRRFLVDDTPIVAVDSDPNERPSLAIPEDIAEEDEDEDYTFPTSAVSESAPLTVLSPPPNQRSYTPSPAPTPVSSREGRPPTTARLSPPKAPTRPPPRIPPPILIQAPRAESPSSLAETSFFTPSSPSSPPLNEPPSFYHSDEEDEDEDESVSATEDDWFTTSDMPVAGAAGPDPLSRRNLSATLSTYSLPRTAAGDNKLSGRQRTPVANLGSPALVARNGNDVPVGNTSLLTSPIPNSGLDELMNELSWMADVIDGARN